MSPLAFDKQGKPFAWHRRTRKLLVRMFRNPAARGTCCQVLDAEGNPLYIDAETEYTEFRKAVGNVPGLYRLDQSDDDGVEIDDAQPAYVSIDLSRNVSLAGDGDVDPLVIVEHMFAIHADVMKTMAMQQANIMAASAEILRAPFRPPMPASERESREEADDEEEDDELEPAPEPDPWASWRPLIKMAEPHLGKLGEFLFVQFVAFMKKNAAPPAAATSSLPGPASAAYSAATQSQSAESAGAAAGSSSASSTSGPSPASVPGAASTPTTSGSSTGAAAPAGPSSARVDNGPTESVPADSESTRPSHASPPHTPAATNAASTEAAAPRATAATKSTGASSTSSTGTALAITPAAAGGTPRNAPPTPEPTPEQWQHLYEVRERLSPKERAIAENAIMRMDAELLERWLADLSALSVDEGVATIRSMIAKLRPPRGTEKG